MSEGVPGESESLALYHSQSCWFCARVRHTIQELGIEIELRDVDRDSTRREELRKGGGKVQVPCLRIEDAAKRVSWMYESADISAYLTRTFKQ